jgi:hypothetical protein
MDAGFYVRQGAYVDLFTDFPGIFPCYQEARLQDQWLWAAVIAFLYNKINILRQLAISSDGQSEMRKHPGCCWTTKSGQGLLLASNFEVYITSNLEVIAWHARPTPILWPECQS